MAEERGTTAAAGGPPIPWGLLVLAWLLPGSGHLVLGRKRRAAVFFGVILAAFVTGLSLHGELVLPQAGNPFSLLKAFADLGSGAFFFLGRLTGAGRGDPTAAGWAFGNTFLFTAGMMNWLVVLDVSDLARGLKE